jgi:hypothetical protein
MVGGIAFILLCSVLPELLGRLLGVGLLGAALGLTIVTVEQIFRTASMTVVWAPKETTTVTLGTTPVSIGGGDDHVVIRGLPRRAVVIGMEQGKIFCTELTSGKKTQLKDKSTIDVGKVQIVITAKA